MMNHTGSWLNDMDVETRKALEVCLRRETQRRMAAGEEKESRKREAEHDQAVVAKKRKQDAIRQAKSDSNRQLLLDPVVIVDIPPDITIPKIVLQLD